MNKDLMPAVEHIGFFQGATDIVDYLIKNGEMVNEAKATPKIVTINGNDYLYANDRLTYIAPIPPVDLPSAPTLRFFTLDGLIEYIDDNPERIIPDIGPDASLVLQVEDHRTVRLLSNPSRETQKRHVIAECIAHAPDITYAKYLDVDAFNTMLLSTFVPTESRDTLFSVVKSLTREQSCNTTDDGVSQVVTVKQGVSMASHVIFKNPVPLVPMRTFSEVPQPESSFIMRVDESAKVALFEADGGEWKNRAVANIKSYIDAHLCSENVVVLA